MDQFDAARPIATAHLAPVALGAYMAAASEAGSYYPAEAREALRAFTRFDAGCWEQAAGVRDVILSWEEGGGMDSVVAASGAITPAAMATMEAGGWGADDLGAGKAIDDDTRADLKAVMLRAHNIAHHSGFSSAAVVDCALEMVTAYAQDHTFSSAHLTCVALAAYDLAASYMADTGIRTKATEIDYAAVRRYTSRHCRSGLVDKYKQNLAAGVDGATCRWTAYKHSAPAGGSKRKATALKRAWATAMEEVRDAAGGRALDLTTGSDDYAAVRERQMAIVAGRGYEVASPAAASDASDNDDPEVVYFLRPEAAAALPIAGLVALESSGESSSGESSSDEISDSDPDEVFLYDPDASSSRRRRLQQARLASMA